MFEEKRMRVGRGSWQRLNRCRSGKAGWQAGCRSERGGCECVRKAQSRQVVNASQRSGANGPEGASEACGHGGANLTASPPASCHPGCSIGKQAEAGKECWRPDDYSALFRLLKIDISLRSVNSWNLRRLEPARAGHFLLRLPKHPDPCSSSAPAFTYDKPGQAGDVVGKRTLQTSASPWKCMRSRYLDNGIDRSILEEILCPFRRQMPKAGGPVGGPTDGRFAAVASKTVT
jgi:hypothetical protein